MARGEGDFAPALACPSAPARAGAGLLGVAAPDGRIAFLRTLMQIDEEFLVAARAAGVPEARMRFTHACQTSACQQWTGRECGVITRVLAAMGPDLKPLASASPCPIRGTCRWFAQEGAIACAACAEVLTDTREPA